MASPAGDRHPQRLTTTDPSLTKIAADILDPAAIEPHLEGIDAVISTVGIGASKAPTSPRLFLRLSLATNSEDSLCSSQNRPTCIESRPAA